MIGSGPDTGVIDVTTGCSATRTCSSATVPPMPANVGANPSLTITALAERAMSFIPAKS